MFDLPAGASFPPQQKTPASRLSLYLQAGWCRAILLFVAAFVAHFPALSGEFLWDDLYLAHDNPFIKSPLLILEVFRHHLYLDSYSPHYRPVQALSYLFDYFFWNDNPYGFHLTNVCLQGACGLLLYFLLRRLLATLVPKLEARTAGWVAFFVALLWAVHPVHSAAVDYVSGRADSLTFCFAATAWLLYLRASDATSLGRRLGYYSLSGFSWLLSLCSRETGCLWLFIFALYTLFFAGRTGRRRRLLLVSGCFAVIAIYGGLHSLPGKRSAPGEATGWTLPVRTVLAFRALGDYGRLMVWPANLHMERTVLNPENYQSDKGWAASVSAEYLSILGLFCLLLATITCCWRSPGRRLRIFGMIWFAIGFLPISNLFDLNATVAEHWLYLPSVGILLWLAGLVLDLPGRRGIATAALASMAVLALSARSYERSSDWVTAEHFYESTIAAGGETTRVDLNLGQLYVQRGDYARGEKLFRHVLSQDPDYPIAQNNLAGALYHQGKTKEAESFFAAATSAAKRDRLTYARTWLATVNLASVEQQKGNSSGALKILEQARKDYPGIWEVVSQESELLREMKRPRESLQLVGDFAHTHWWHYGAFVALGRLEMAAGETEKAADDLRHASRLDVHEVDALNLVAGMRVRQNQLVEAYRLQKLAIARQPDSPRQYVLLSDILEKMGQTEAARNAIAQVTRLEAIGRSSHSLPN